MSKKRKHLTLSDRIVIEKGLHQRKSFAQIARELNKDPTTVSKEVRRNAVVREHNKQIPIPCTANNDIHNRCHRKHVCGDNDCQQTCRMCRKYRCNEVCPYYTPRECGRLQKPPYVCNGCEHRSGCTMDRKVYSSKYADDCYHIQLKTCREGINQTPESIQRMNDLLTPLIRDNKQSIAHIYATHAEELGCSRRTLYSYIDKGIFDVRNIDLRRAVRYKKRKKPTQAGSKDRSYRKEHNYNDFLERLKAAPHTAVVEMDCVEGGRGGKTLLTFFFRSCDLMLLFLMNSHTQDEVLYVFDRLEGLLGLEIFQKTFPLILTDGGSEFACRDRLETSPSGSKRTEIFYCDPYSSWQKGGIEKNHEYIRLVVPKGKSFDRFSQEDMLLLTNHINSEYRDSLNGHSPFELSSLLLDNKLHECLGLKLIPPDEVNLSPSLLK